MNILPKKRWHVRTKENMARVRRDEAKAAADEKAKLERARLAEHEDRINRLRRNAGIQEEDPFSQKPSGSHDPSISSTGHVNFFTELEEQERKNLAGGGNKEYQAEKKREQQEWESKMGKLDLASTYLANKFNKLPPYCSGIMKRFAEDTKELNRESNWWEKIERTESESRPQEKMSSESKKSDKELRRRLKKQIKEEKKRKKKAKKQRHHRSSSSSSDSDSEKKELKRQKLEVLRKERLERELAEQKRVRQLLGENVKEERPREPTYSNQFNPDLVRRR